MSDCIEVPEAPNWLKDFEARREHKLKTKLGHEAGAGAPCLTCESKCPGLDLHFWRKICKNCKCSKESHDVPDDDISGWAQFQLLGSKPNKIKHKIVLFGKKDEVELDWAPKGNTKTIDKYLQTLPEDQLPIKGSQAAQDRKQLLQKQIPVHDIDPTLCHDLTEEELKQMNEYIAHVKQNSVGVGQIISLADFIKGTLHNINQSEANIIASKYNKNLSISENLNTTPMQHSSTNIGKKLENLSINEQGNNKNLKQLPNFVGNTLNTSVSEQNPIISGIYRDKNYPGYSDFSQQQALGNESSNNLQNRQFSQKIGTTNFENSKNMFENNQNPQFSSPIGSKIGGKIADFEKYRNPPSFLNERGNVSSPNKQFGGALNKSTNFVSNPGQIDNLANFETLQNTNFEAEGRNLGNFGAQFGPNQNFNINDPEYQHLAKNLDQFGRPTNFGSNFDPNNPSYQQNNALNQKYGQATANFDQYGNPIDVGANFDPNYQGNDPKFGQNTQNYGSTNFDSNNQGKNYLYPKYAHNADNYGANYDPNNPYPENFAKILDQYGKSIDFDPNNLNYQGPQYAKNIDANNPNVKEDPRNQFDPSRRNFGSAKQNTGSTQGNENYDPNLDNFGQDTSILSKNPNFGQERCIPSHPGDVNLISNQQNLPNYAANKYSHFSDNQNPKKIGNVRDLAFSTYNDQNLTPNNNQTMGAIGDNRKKLPQYLPGNLNVDEQHLDPKSVKIGGINDLVYPEVHTAYQEDNYVYDETPKAENIRNMLENNKSLTCHRCKEKFEEHEFAIIIDRADCLFHTHCFKCFGCNQNLADNVYFYNKENDQIYCGRDFAKIRGFPRCNACDELIFTKEYCLTDDATFHVKHFCCFECDKPLANQSYVIEGSQPCCIPCFEDKKAGKCAACFKVIKPDEVGLTLKDLHFHADDNCFVCKVCRKPMLNQKLLLRNDKLYCSHDCFGADQ